MVVVRHFKVCRSCGREKNVDYFGRDNSSPDGWKPRCWECEKGVPGVVPRRVVYETVGTFDKDGAVLTKRCVHCGRVLPAREFYTREESPDGLHCWCRGCSVDAHRIRAKKYARKRTGGVWASLRDMVRGVFR